MTTSKAPNRLAREKSPYLLQHAHNPVDWYPWGEEAFAKAKTEDKPIFLSIGYSTCHWCHVMERESFEDTEVANLLNRFFIAIKVDREERPDIDHLYMQFCQALTGSGGWPLTILMTPGKEPFFAGTYFPKTQKYGRLGLIELLEQTGSLWLTQESRIRQSAREILQAVQAQKTPLQNAPAGTLHRMDKANEAANWGEQVCGQAYQALRRSFDARYGGFGTAPKFPSPHVLGFLLRYAYKHPQSEALKMVSKTLDGMARGGIYDHIGFGFARYSTDEKWLVPHFEKMLYDNALLALAYLESFQMQHRENDAQKAREIFTYVLRDMASPEGAFYSAEDADSEGSEGKFYVWSRAEVTGILGEESGEIYCSAYNITDKGNFEGKNIPQRSLINWTPLAEEYHLSLDALLNSLAASRQKLFETREKRIHPHKDDKILTSWNGLMIAALAKASQVLMNKVYLEAAEKALRFILKNLRREDGRLLARYRDGQAGYLAYLDDYAFLVWGLLELYTAGGKAVYLRTALEIQEQQNSLFMDQKAGGYFLTGSDGEELLMRPKEFYDGALPSGNSISALNLLRLARITAEPKWDELAQRHLAAFAQSLKEQPTGCTAFLQAIQFALYGTQELVLAGSLDAPDLPGMRKVYFSDFRPFATLLYQEGTIGNDLPWMKEYSSKEDTTTAYLCQNLACQAPVTSPENLASLLNQG